MTSPVRFAPLTVKVWGADADPSIALKALNDPDVESEGGATTVPLPVRDGRMTLTDTPGHGVIFDGPALHEYEVR